MGVFIVVVYSIPWDYAKYAIIFQTVTWVAGPTYHIARRFGGELGLEVCLRNH